MIFPILLMYFGFLLWMFDCLRTASPNVMIFNNTIPAPLRIGWRGVTWPTLNQLPMKWQTKQLPAGNRELSYWWFITVERHLCKFPAAINGFHFLFFSGLLFYSLKKNRIEEKRERGKREKGKKKGWPIRLANYSSGPYLTCTGPYHDDCARNFPCPLPSPFPK